MLSLDTSRISADNRLYFAFTSVAADVAGIVSLVMVVGRDRAYGVLRALFLAARGMVVDE